MRKDVPILTYLLGNPDWKREEIPEHKFNFINIYDFIDNSFHRKFEYIGVFALTLKDIMVYIADLLAVVLVLSTNGLNTTFQSKKL